MIKDYRLSRIHLEEYDRTFHAYISYAYRKKKEIKRIVG